MNVFAYNDLSPVCLGAGSAGRTISVKHAVSKEPLSQLLTS